MAFDKETIYTINGSGSGFDDVLATSPPAAAGGSKIPITLGFARRMVINETYAAGSSPNALGLQYQRWNPSTKAWGPTIQDAPNEPIYIGDEVAEGTGRGPVLGMVAQANFASSAPGASSRAADTPIRIISGTAAATLVKVRETQ